MALTASDYANLAAAFGPSLITGIGQGGQASADRQLTAEEIQRQIEQQLYNRRQAGRAGLTAFYQGQLGRDLDAGEMLADRAPLGAEQNFAEQMARRRGLGQVASQYQPSGGMSPAASAFALQSPNMLAPYAGADYQQTVSRDATARSIAERRKALAGVDPNFQFGSMGDYGLPDLGGEVSQYAQGVQSRRQQSEQEMLRLLTEQMREASAAQIPGQTPTTTAAGAASAAQTKKPSLLKRIANVALTAAPIVAAPFTSGTSLALIGAGAGAAKGLLGGGGVQGALTGGLTGAASSALMGGAPQMRGEAASSAIKRAILNPRALAQLAGGAVGGQTGDALTMASAALPGMRQGPRGLVTDNRMTEKSLPVGLGPAARPATQLLPLEPPTPPVPQTAPQVAASTPTPAPRRPATPPPPRPAAPDAGLQQRGTGALGLSRMIQQNLKNLQAGGTQEDAMLELLAQRPEMIEQLADPAARAAIVQRLQVLKEDPRMEVTGRGPYGPIYKDPPMLPWDEVDPVRRWIAAYATAPGTGPGLMPPTPVFSAAPWMLPLMALGKLPPVPATRAIDQFLRRKR